MDTPLVLPDTGHVDRRHVLGAVALMAMTPLLLAQSESGNASAATPYAWQTQDEAELGVWVEERLAKVQCASAAIASSADRPSIAATLAPYDSARNELAIAANQLQVISHAGTTERLRATAGRLLGRVNDTAAQLDLDSRVHAAMVVLSRSAALEGADAATRRYVAQVVLRGRLAGADRDTPTRAAIEALQAQIARLGERYMANLQKATGRVETDARGLRGMPDDFVARHRPDGRDVVALSASSIDVQPVLRFAADPDLRRRMYLARENLAYPDNAAALADLVTARAELASALGYVTYTDLALADQMIGTAAAADTLLDRIDTIARPLAAVEAATLQSFARSVDPDAVVTAADAVYWTERYTSDRLGLDGQALRAYFPFDRVRAGIIAFATDFFGVRFAEVAEASTWHPNVVVFDVFDAQVALPSPTIGRIYIDAHPRPGKTGIFATAPLVPGIAGRQRPEGVILCNLPGGAQDHPGLLSHADVVNFLHEFGHLMHHVLAGQGRWAALGAFDTEEDFLEAPSQMLEEFARDPAMLQRFARHYRTGEPLPAAMIESLRQSSAFGRARWVCSQVRRARFALAIHRRPADEKEILAAYQASGQDENGATLTAEGHGYAAWPHVVGYGPNYYMYLLDKVIAVDMASRFATAGPSDRIAAKSYRRAVLEPGATRAAAALVHDFLGRAENLDALTA